MKYLLFAGWAVTLFFFLAVFLTILWAAIRADKPHRSYPD